ncbi:MAG: hypothetical protein MUF53_09240, partial [Gemmatimonadaceae bacterium]|nr:hypothetical protein [Gemmatimonadaceae bacterium]
LDGYPVFVAEGIRSAWALLPLPFHVTAAAASLDGVDSAVPHVATLLVGAMCMLAGAGVVLRLRITTGRWS